MYSFHTKHTQYSHDPDLDHILSVQSPDLKQKTPTQKVPPLINITKSQATVVTIHIDQMSPITTQFSDSS